jgi:hypothetical protein
LVAVRIDNSWKRGRVARIREEETAQQTSIEVFLVDSGLTEAAVRPEDMVPLPDQFITRLPFQVERGSEADPRARIYLMMDPE